jgi:hypothetical protein
VLVTVAEASPPVIDTVRIGHASNVAVTVFEASIVTVQVSGPVTVHPLQPANVEVESG